MSEIKKALDLVKEGEGFVATPYRCPAGKLTIGYGRNIEANPLTNEERAQLIGGAVTKKDAEAWAIKELEKIHNELSKFAWFLALDENRRAAILDMSYNLGIRGLLGFKKTIEAISQKNWEKAGAELENSKWFFQVGRRAKKIKKIIETGEIF